MPEKDFPPITALERLRDPKSVQLMNDKYSHLNEVLEVYELLLLLSNNESVQRMLSEMSENLTRVEVQQNMLDLMKEIADELAQIKSFDAFLKYLKNIKAKDALLAANKVRLIYTVLSQDPNNKYLLAAMDVAAGEVDLLPSNPNQIVTLTREDIDSRK